jgi:hypothetical protein
MVDLLQPLASPARISDLVVAHDVLDFVAFRPGAGCASLHMTGEPAGLSFPSRSALLPLFPEGSGLGPTTAAVDPGGQLNVLVQGGTRIANVGAMGWDAAKYLDLTGAEGAPLPLADRPERFAYSNRGVLLASNKSGLFRIHKKTGRVLRLLDWPAPTLPEFGSKGSAACCDLVHIADPRGGGAWLVSPPASGELWVLDDAALTPRTKSRIGKIDGLEAVAVRQLRSILSTGWVYAVVQVAAEPDYDARIVLWKYPLWNGVDEVAAP